MKVKVALFALVAGLLVAGPLTASEAIWEVVVPTALQPSSLIVPAPLSEPAPVAAEILDAVPAEMAAAGMAVIRPLPMFGPVGRSSKALFDANLVLMVGLNVADYVSTREALKYPGLAETNPLMKPFAKNAAAFAAVKFGTTALSYLSLKAIFKRNKAVAWIVTTASNALLSYVVASNYHLIQGARAAAR